MKLSLVKGTTSKLVQIFVLDSSSTVGAGLTGLVYNSASLTAYYYREGAGSAVAISLVTMTLGTWTSGGFVVVDGTNMPGVYQLALPDAALASGAKSVVVMLKGAANMAPVLLEIELTVIDNQVATAAAVWDEAISGHVTAGTTGATLNAVPSSTTIAAAVWAYVVEGSYTAVQFLRLCTATLVGKLSGAATTTIYIRDTADSKNRAVVTVDAYGNRSGVTLDAS